MAETIMYTPENQANNVLPWMLASQNNNGFFGGAGGSAFWGALIGSFVPGLFGGWNGNGFGNGSSASAASLGAQATANSNTETILRAIDGTDSDIRLLATTANADFDSLKVGIAGVQGGIAQLSAQTGLTGQQIINSIQAGDATLAHQLCECCCNMRQLTVEQGYQNQLRTVEQTNALGGAIAGSGQRTIDAIADLKTTMVKEFCDVKEREMQEKINSLTASNTLLRSQIDNAAQTSAIAGLIAPIAKEVDDIKCKLPNTVSVTYPNLYAVNATPYVSGGYYQGGFNGLYGAPGLGGFGGITF